MADARRNGAAPGMAVAAPQPACWSVYVLRCGDGSLYTGIATDVARRIDEHQNTGRGAKYLRGRGPLHLELQQAVGSRSDASRAEHRIKQLPRAAKEALLESPQQLERLLEGAVVRQ